MLKPTDRLVVAIALCVGACSGATPSPKTGEDASAVPRLRGGPPSSETLGEEDPCVFGPAGPSELIWRVTAAEDTTVLLWVADRWAHVGEQRPPIDDREVREKPIGVKHNVPHEFKLWLGAWTQRTGDSLRFDLMAKFPDGEQIQVPNSSCKVP